MNDKLINVLFLWCPDDQLLKFLADGLAHLKNVNLIVPPNTESKTLCRLAPKADVIIGWNPTKEILDVASNLKMFINPGAGVKHLIDLFRTYSSKISLINGHGNSYLTAQHALALLLALSNKVVLHHNWMAQGAWRLGDNEAASIPLRDKTVGLLGYGAINKKVHRFLSGFDIDFAICRHSWLEKEVPPNVLTFENSELKPFLRAIDILIIAIPHTSYNENLIDAEALALLGPHSLLINVGRGLIVNQEALFLALRNKTIAGAAIDVWYDYTPAPDDCGFRHPAKFPFYQLENLIMSPHRAASPFSDLKRWQEVIDNISRLAVGCRDFTNLIDLEREY